MSDCIIATGNVMRRGYIRVYLGKRGRKNVTKLAHRLAWEEAHGPIPPDMEVCHKCDNPPCRNVEHLFLGTTQDNQADKVAKGRQAKGSSHGRAKLTEETAVFAMARLLSGESQVSVAAAFGVTPALTCQLWKGSIWKHAFAQDTQGV